jgi:hypothetical protein
MASSKEKEKTDSGGCISQNLGWSKQRQQRESSDNGLPLGILDHIMTVTAGTIEFRAVEAHLAWISQLPGIT